MRDRHVRSGSVTRHVSIDTRDERDALTVTHRDVCDGERDATVTPNVTDERPERLEARAHRCGVVDETGQPCSTFTLHERCHKHRGGGIDASTVAMKTAAPQSDA
jgi:hypothetical protein